MYATRRGSASSTPARKPFKAIRALACPNTSKSRTNAVLVSNLLFINFHWFCAGIKLLHSCIWNTWQIFYIHNNLRDILLDPDRQIPLWVEKPSISQTSIDMILEKNFSSKIIRKSVPSTSIAFTQYLERLIFSKIDQFLKKIVAKQSLFFERNKLVQNIVIMKF